MSSAIRVLLVEDVPEDAELLTRELRKGSLEVVTRLVDDEQALRHALTDFSPDVILSDYNLPDFNGTRALEISQAMCPEVPFIFVSGTIGEERAIEALHRGADDYVLKNNRVRLLPAVERALQNARDRALRRDAERQLAASEYRFSSIVDATQEWIWEIDVTGVLTFSSAAGSAILGYAPEELVGARSFDFIDYGEREASRQNLQRAASEKRGWHNQVTRWRHKDGIARFLESTALPLFDGSGEVVGYRGASRDITLRIQQQEKITRLSRIRAVSSGINGLIMRLRDRDQVFQDACRIAVEQGGFRMAWVGTIDPDTLEGKAVAWAGAGTDNIKRLMVTARPELPDSERPSCRALREKCPVVCNDIAGEPALIGLRDNAEAHGCRSVAALPLSTDGRVDAVIVLFAGERHFFDRLEIELLEELAADLSFALGYLVKQEKLNYVSYHDPLTGLANREMFFDRLSQTMTAMPQDRRRLGVIVIDLLRFRLINDTLGRGRGDDLLKAFARRLKATFDVAPTLARVGGDRFAVAISGLGASALGQFIKERILRSLEEPFALAGENLRVACKIGIAMFPDDARDAETLFRNAEAALQRAKDTTETYEFYSPEMNAQVAKRLYLEDRLRNAVRNRQFLLEYQPKVELSNRLIVGLEALIRWRDPDCGMVSPLDFIPVLEETGMIVEVGRWVIEQAVEDVRGWQAEGLQAPRVAVNVSHVQVRQKDFVTTVLDAAGLTTHPDIQLDLEITESLVLEDPESGIEKLRQLRAAGMRIYMDDFGTGYSNLGQMAALPLDALKIDRIFIARMAESESATAIVSTIINLAIALRIDVVAEGVETSQQASLLSSLGCNQAQGYFFSRPHPSREIARMLRTSQYLTPRKVA